jgi:glutamine amidotransferase PdxT
MMATTFHPELTGDPTIHRLFVDRIAAERAR